MTLLLKNGISVNIKVVTPSLLLQLMQYDFITIAILYYKIKIVKSYALIVCLDIYSQSFFVRYWDFYNN